jgi:cell division protein FtsZ
MDYIEVIEDAANSNAEANTNATINASSNTAMSAMGEVLLNASKPPVTIKVVGVGGGGGNAVTHMIRAGIKNVSYITVNTDSQALYKTPADIKIQLGENGQGAGANPNVARAYAESARPQLMEALKGADMVFITAGLGKGTGTGASAVVAQVAKELGALTVSVVTKPFTSEGPMRAKIADAAADELGLHSDSLITVLNSKLEALNPDGLMKEWYQAADDVLKSAVSTIVEIIQSNGYQNVDFRDVVSVMGSNRGRALMGTARATGKDRAKTAALAAVCSQLLEEENLRTARGVLINITAAEDSMRGREITEIIDTIRSHCSDDVTPIYGTTFDDNMGDELQVTVIVSGIGARSKVSLAANLPEVNRQSNSHSGFAANLASASLSSPTTQAYSQAQSFESAVKTFEQSVPEMVQRTGTDDVSFVVPSVATPRVEAMPHSLPLNLGSSNPAIPTLTQEVAMSASAGMGSMGSMGNTGNSGVLDASSLMFNPSAMGNPKMNVQNQVKAMQAQGIPSLEIPTFLRNQVN